MSGLVGIVNCDGAPVDRDLLARLTASMAFRGPDRLECWSDGNIGFGHALLQTTAEAEPAVQPLTLGDGIWITADARIDDRAGLIERLKDDGNENLEYGSDAELILAAYRRWGENCPQFLLGDFAFAVWDSPRQRLFCARDHFGVKPFYYADTGKTLIFSNTLECIRQHPAVSNRLNDLAIADFLLFGHNPEPATTTFADIARLPPGHGLCWSATGLKLARYWSLRVSQETRYATVDQYIERFKELLIDAVDDRLRAPRVAIYMSGGLDSPALAAAACRWAGASTARSELKTYCLVYDRMPDDERYYSSIAAESLAIPIDHMPVDDYALFERSGEPEIRRPEPFDWPLVALNRDSLSRVAAHGRVVLYGEDPDALLAPSSLFNLLRWTDPWRAARDIGSFAVKRRRWPPLGLGLRAKLTWLAGHGRSKSPFPPYPPWLNPSLARRYQLPDRWRNRPQIVAPEDGMIRPEAHRRLASPLWQRLFEFNDPGATRIAVEHRYPYLDLRLVSFMLSLPTFPWCIDKYLLRAALDGRFPASISERPKTPLACDPYREPLQRPEAKWLDGFAAVQRLDEYVIREKVPPVTGSSYDANQSWLHLRPLILNEWLRTARV